MNQQPSLLSLAEQADKPRKRVRQVSSAGYAVVRAETERRQQFFLRKLAAYRNRYAVWPTIPELVDWVFRLHEIGRNDPNVMRPRATELVDRGVCVYGTKRRCRITGRTAAPVQIVEVGAERDRSRDVTARIVGDG